MIKFLSWLLLSVACVGQTVTYTKAYTGTDVLQAGPAPFVATDPAGTTKPLPLPYYGSMCRLTDPNTLSSMKWAMQGESLSLTNQNTSLLAIRNLGGVTYIFGFNVSSKCAIPGPPTVACAGSGAFSRVRQYRYFCVQAPGWAAGSYTANGTTLFTVDFASADPSTCGQPNCYNPASATWTPLFDFASCPVAPTGTPNWRSFLIIGRGDSDALISFSWTGGQDTARYFFDYMLSWPNTCTTVDTIGDGITPQWYTNTTPNPVVNYLTGVPFIASYKIHEVSGNGVWAEVSAAQCVGADCGAGSLPTIYELSTDKAYSLNTQPHASGHATVGVNSFYNHGNPVIWSRSLLAPGTTTQVSSAFGGEDMHLSADIRNDSNPILMSRGGIATTTWTQPYMNEIVGFVPDGSVFYRFTPTWSSGPATNFYGQYAVSGFSQDRRWLFLTSDMGCVRTDCGTDVYALPLR